MRILIVGLNFAPEVIGVGKYTGEIAAWLAGRGHHVSIVTTRPYYPEWPRTLGVHSFTWTRERWNGCEVTRCPLAAHSRQTGAGRILHLASFALSSIPAAALSLVRSRIDVVLTVAPTLLAAPATLLMARLAGAKTWIHFQDFEIAAAARLGIIAHRRLVDVGLSAERALLKRFDLVSAISPTMVETLSKSGVAPERLLLFPNWTDTTAFRPTEETGYRERLGIGTERCIALYAGNLGAKQGLDHVIAAARLLSTNSDRRPLFVIAGAGAARVALEYAAADLTNVRFLPLQPPEAFNEFLNMGDIQLMPQLSEVNDLVMPSKLGAMLAVGKPIVATVHPDSLIAKTIKGAGVVVPPGNPQALADAIVDLMQDPVRRAAMGKVARETALAFTQPEDIFLRTEARLLDLIANRR